MSKKVCLTGIKATGMPHLGNYVGAIKPAIDMANSGLYDSYYFIADYHSLVSIHDPKLMRSFSYEVAAAWLAMGLDPSRVTLYKQSDIPEILELHWITSCFTIKGLMNRAHAYKAQVQDNEVLERDADHGVNIGLYTYPILMASDIMILNADVVPVGADQLQHIEIARDIATAFNNTYGNKLKLPKAIVREGNKLLSGLDGRKMSKSYGNHIPLFSSDKDLKKLINRITTDSSGPTEPKNPAESLIFDFYSEFATPEQTEALRARYLRGIGWGEAKMELLSVLNHLLKEPREMYAELMVNTTKIDRILEEGAAKVRPQAQALLKDLKYSIGVK
ncbi:MAG: tryptophan--tRNA ligase [Bacteriovorax sp.]|nr:tryptophan--tRNA ligase [Bacteriovorax sp.]